MAPALASALVAACFVAQTPPSSVAGSGGAAGAKSGGTTQVGATKRPGHDLADLLMPFSGTQSGTGPRRPPSPPVGGNVQVSSASSKAQYGPMCVVDPTDRLHLLAAADDGRGQGQAAFYASFDGGLTWSETLEDETSMLPCAAFGDDGSIYVAKTTIELFQGGKVLFGRSFDGGLTFGSWVTCVTFSSSGFASLRSIDLDRSSGPNAGSVYAATDDQSSDSSGPHESIVVWHSRDDGQSFSGVDPHDGGPWDPARNSSMAVDSKGVIHVVWFDGGRTILADASTDGGGSFKTDVKVADAKTFSIPDLTTTETPAPRLAIDRSGGPFNDRLYVAWAQDGGTTGPDVVVSSSSDGGATWSTPVLATDSANLSQYAPSLAVDPLGHVVVGYFDAQGDPANHSVLFRVSRSSDGGATFLPSVALSDVRFDPTQISNGYFIADRTGVAASDRGVTGVWSDGRNGDLDVYAATANLALSTDVDSISAATGGTATFALDAGPNFAFAEYHLLGSASGTTPGTDFFFENVPVNFDLFMLATIVEANGPIFPGFTGTLDASGAATAQLVSGPLPPSLIGVEMDFAIAVRVNNAVRWGSAPTKVGIGN